MYSNRLFLLSPYKHIRHYFKEQYALKLHKLYNIFVVLLRKIIKKNIPRIGKLEKGGGISVINRLSPHSFLYQMAISKD